jgi:hypothetical protein
MRPNNINSIFGLTEKSPGTGQGPGDPEKALPLEFSKPRRYGTVLLEEGL